MIYRIKKPFILIIFGASGDLAKLKLFPALYSLMEQSRLPEKFHIIGFARTSISQAEFKKQFEKSIKSKHKVDRKILKKLTGHISYFQGQYKSRQDFKDLRAHCKTLTKSSKTTKLAYFSVPPQTFKDIIRNLGETKPSANEDLRLILEKPLGENTETAKELFHFTAQYFDENNIYLLDHYLGKAAVQSLLGLRHHNRMLNLMMKGNAIANIQITATENFGVFARGGYFDRVGMLKDMVQSHLLQILALIAMSIPITENADSLHREKYSILKALKFNPSGKNIALGQYEGYKKEKNIPPNSKTETFAALKLFIDRESWYKTPIYIRTGKNLNKKQTYIVIEIKKFDFQKKDEEPNRLIIELQPEERIGIKLVNAHKSQQGATSEYREVTTSDSIACTGDYCLPEHGLLLLDVMRCRRIHFLSFEEIIASWEIVDCILKFIKKSKIKPKKYPIGSAGPNLKDVKWYELD